MVVQRFQGRIISNASDPYLCDTPQVRGENKVRWLDCGYVFVYNFPVPFLADCFFVVCFCESGGKGESEAVEGWIGIYILDAFLSGMRVPKVWLKQIDVFYHRKRYVVFGLLPAFCRWWVSKRWWDDIDDCLTTTVYTPRMCPTRVMRKVAVPCPKAHDPWTTRNSYLKIYLLDSFGIHLSHDKKKRPYFGILAMVYGNPHITG